MNIHGRRLTTSAGGPSGHSTRTVLRLATRYPVYFLDLDRDLSTNVTFKVTRYDVILPLDTSTL